MSVRHQKIKSRIINDHRKSAKKIALIKTKEPSSIDGEYSRVPPNASASIVSYRAFGYDIKTSIADLIDNSISAGAKNVWLEFYWNGKDSTISIKDDGHGMTEKRLKKQCVLAVKILLKNARMMISEDSALD
jgi:signal transduction histidine kinase